MERHNNRGGFLLFRNSKFVLKGILFDVLITNLLDAIFSQKLHSFFPLGLEGGQPWRIVHFTVVLRIQAFEQK